MPATTITIADKKVQMASKYPVLLGNNVADWETTRLEEECCCDERIKWM
jgi:hypothetical protein